jgi:regulator of protease activity HflC (stomatin/prohibitin superfamily)
LTVSDIDIPQNIQDARESKAKAAEELEAAENKNKTLVLNSETDAKVIVNKATAEAEAIKQKGKALADQIKSLIDDGKIEPKEAAEMIVNIKKWESLGDKTVVLESGMSDSVLKRFVELGILAQTGSNIVKP